jgi:octaprenyl-diphosphate synthase
MDIQYNQRIQNIEAALERWLPGRSGPDWGAEVFPGIGNTIDNGLLQALAAPGRDLLSRGGKRWRPLLLTLVCETLGGADAALPLVPLVEFSHNASLIHDDIEDNSEERRGKAAVHLIHGVDTAINGGCFLYFLPTCCIEPWASALASRAGHAPALAVEYSTKVYSLWAAYMRKLHLGQAMDIHWHRNFSVVPEIEEYYTMCGLKTGCLARFAAELGVYAAAAVTADLSGGSMTPDIMKEVQGLLGQAAEKLGVGFQILDDVKNLTTGIPGKKRGDDMVEGKKSLPILLYMHRYPEQRKKVAHCFSAAERDGVSAPEVEELIGALEAAGITAEAAERGKALIAEARSIFTAPECGGFPLRAEGRTLLAGLIDFIS